jgi:hypothetical protein
VEKKRSIPNTINTEGLHKYFKPLREISNHQIASLVTESKNSNNLQTDSSAELCLPLTSIPSTVANTHESAVNNEQTLLHYLPKSLLCQSQDQIHQLNLVHVLLFLILNPKSILMSILVI